MTDRIEYSEPGRGGACFQRADSAGIPEAGGVTVLAEV
jgi:hypothetical protein